ncbi:MAG: photosynthetic reaction center subunit H, partial [Pseudomonadota bacterium]
MGEIVGELDTTTVLLYAFWAFFGYLCFYLQKESRREGYPLETDEWGKVKKTGVIFMPDPKTFRLPHGHGTVQKPDGIRETRELKLRALEPTSGTPYEPTGNPMLDGIGPGAYAERADVPDVTLEGEVKIVPLRA